MLRVQAAAGKDQGGQTFGASDSLAQPSDAAASGFYITNPNNRVTSNAASGGYSGEKEQPSPACRGVGTPGTLSNASLG